VLAALPFVVRERLLEAAEPLPVAVDLVVEPGDRFVGFEELAPGLPLAALGSTIRRRRRPRAEDCGADRLRKLSD
jgi:hypothetical protein